jgi:hypothetical protein
MAQLAADLEPILARQHDVEDDEVVVATGGAKQALIAIAAGIYLVALPMKPLG